MNKAQLVRRYDDDDDGTPDEVLLGTVSRVDGKDINPADVRRLWQTFQATEPDEDGAFADYLASFGYVEHTEDDIGVVVLD